MLNKAVKPIWLASYPKSGNTWVRLFLSALLSKKELDINNIETDGIISSRYIIDSTLGINSAEIPEKDFLPYRSQLYHKWANTFTQKEYLLCKVHDSCILEGEILFPPEITRGVIYIIRNPFDMVASMANHSGITIDQSAKMLCNNNYKLAAKKSGLNTQISQHLGTWSQHIETWTNIHRDNMIVIRYEDMLLKGLETFSKIVNYLELQSSSEMIEEAIRLTSFDTIQKIEDQTKFSEKPKKSELFFRSGKIGGWKNEITNDQAKHIIDCNFDTLLKYQYISPNGDIIV